MNVAVERRHGVARTRGFAAVALLLGLVTGIGAVGLPIIAIGLLTTADGGAHRVHLVGYGAWMGAVVCVGFLAMAWWRERAVAAFQQVSLATVALMLAQLLSHRFTPDTLILAAGLIVLALLHPDRRALVRGGGEVASLLVPLLLLLAIPWCLYATGQATLQRGAVPGDVHGDKAHYADMCVVALVIPLVALLSTLRSPGWRVSIWCAAAASTLVGLVSVLNPDLSSSLGRGGGAAAMGSGAVLVVASVWGARRATRVQLNSTSLAADAPGSRP